MTTCLITESFRFSEATCKIFASKAQSFNLCSETKRCRQIAQVFDSKLLSKLYCSKLNEETFYSKLSDSNIEIVHVYIYVTEKFLLVNFLWWKSVKLSKNYLNFFIGSQPIIYTIVRI